MNAPISIVIPALNEEKYLPLLLESLKNQTTQPAQIIVADAGSTDETKKIAADYGCLIVKGGYMPVGRNNGAKAATEDVLLFLDADTTLPPKFIENNLKEFNDRNLDSATCYTSAASLGPLDALGTNMINWYYRFTERFRPHCYGYCIFARKSLHEKINGFDEAAFVGEDQDYIYRAGKVGKFRVLMSEKVNASFRRFAEEGRLKTTLKYFIIEMHILFFGKIHTKIFQFNVGVHKKKG